MTWDPFQREVLAELGHVLYRTTTAAAEATLAELATADPPATSLLNADAAMLARLARAGGVPVEALPGSLRDPLALARLRGDAAAKRALWPRLRALRGRPQ